MDSRFDWFLMFVFVIKIAMSILEKNYEAAFGWMCAVFTLSRVINKNKEQE